MAISGRFLIFLPFIFSFFSITPVRAQNSYAYLDALQSPNKWVDSVYRQLSLEERVAQLFLVRVHPNLGKRHIDSIERIVRTEKLGGVVLFQGNPTAQLRTVNRLQAASKVPLLVAMDAEWGLGMRVPDSTIVYPFQMTLGAIQDNRLIRRMGSAIAEDLRRLGVHVNFAPVVDVNNNPNNPVINFRSFGDRPAAVMAKGRAYMEGLQDGKVLAVLKHFPGHGDTGTDSHYDLPVLNFDRNRLNAVELSPFRALIGAGAGGVMVGHMHVPALDATKNLPSSLSAKVVNGLLRNELGFKGLVFTDAMDMNGVVKYFKNGQADVRAVAAGNDLLELSQNSARAINLVSREIRQGNIPQAQLEASVKRILATKFWMGLHAFRPATESGLVRDLNSRRNSQLNQQLAEAAITVLNNIDPINRLDTRKHTAVLSIGSENITPFQEFLGERLDNSLDFVISANATANDIAKVWVELRRYDQVIVALHDNRKTPRSRLNFNSTVRLYLNELAATADVICLFGNPYALASLPGIEQSKSLVLAYQNDATLQQAAARVILKEIRPTGKLPVHVNAFFKAGDGK